jgi:hypothetical protein
VEGADQVLQQQQQEEAQQHQAEEQTQRLQRQQDQAQDPGGGDAGDVEGQDIVASASRQLMEPHTPSSVVEPPR